MANQRGYLNWLRRCTPDLDDAKDELNFLNETMCRLIYSPAPVELTASDAHIVLAREILEAEDVWIDTNGEEWELDDVVYWNRSKTCATVIM